MSGFTPGSVPSYSVGMPEGVATTQATEQAPINVAENKAKVGAAESQKAQSDLATKTANDQLVQKLVAPAIANPAIADNPQWQKTVAERLQASGLEMPYQEAQNTAGGPIKPGDTPSTEPRKIDMKMLQDMVAPFIKPNAEVGDIAKLQEIPRGPARDARASMFNPASITPQILASDMIPSQATIQEAQKVFSQSLLAAQEGKVTPAAFLAGVNKDMLPYFGQNWDQINHNPQLLAGMTASAQAKLDKMVAAGVLSKAQAAKQMSDVAKAPSIEAMNFAHAKYFGQQGAVLGQREQIAYMNAVTHQQTATAYIREVNQKIDDSNNGSWTAHANLQQKDLSELLKQKRDAVVDERQAYAMLEKAKANGDDYTTPLADGQPSLLDALTNAQASVKAYDMTISQIKNTSLSANAARGQLNAIGGAGVQNKPENSTAPKTELKRQVVDGKTMVKYSDGSYTVNGVPWKPQ